MTEIAVVSHARSDMINKKTLRTLADGGITPESVRVFAAANELDDYKTNMDAGLYGELVEGGVGVAGNHAAVARFYPAGTRLVGLDDDVSGVMLKVDDKRLAPVGDLPALFERGFAAVEEAGIRLWGVYPVTNALFMHNRVVVGLHFLIGHLYGVVNDPTLAPTLPMKIDYERTLAYWSADGAVARLDDVAVKTRMYAPGGLQAVDQAARQTRNRRAVQALLARYPGAVAITKRRGQGGLEIRLTEPASA